MTTPATQSAQLVWQYKDGDGNWQSFGPAHDLGSLKRTRRFALGPRQDVTATEWRLVKVAGHDWGATHFTCSAIRLFNESLDLSPVKIRSFSFNASDQTYFMVWTDQNIEVYRGDLRMCAVPCTHTSFDVREVRTAQVLDTYLAFHVDYAPIRITRQGAHDQWDSRTLIFDSLPTFDYTGERAGGVNEVQQIRFDTYVGGDTFNLTLEGETTDSIVYSATAGTMVTRITDALEGLPNVGTDGVTVTNTGTDTYSVEFVGDNRANDVGELVGHTLISTAGGVSCGTLTQGKAGGEPIISDTRGWPACGTFYQGRLYMGGLRSRPQTVLGSRIGDWFNFASKGSSMAISEDLDTKETTPILALFPGQHLQVFTTSAEFHFTTEPIVPPAPVKRSTNRGLAGECDLFEIDGATLIVTRNGKALAEFIYDDGIQKYRAPYLSKFASHLLAGTKAEPLSITDIGFRRAERPDEGDRAILPRSDGLAAVMHALRDDDVVGFVRWQTDGYILTAAADLAGVEYMAVIRNGEQLLEKVDAGQVLDSAVHIEGAFAGPVTGLGHLEGKTVAIYIDGADAGDADVVGGQVDLPFAALRDTFVGLPFTVFGRTLPGVLERDTRAGNENEPRVGIISMELGPTSQLQGGLVGGRMWDFKLATGEDGGGPGEEPFSGWTKLEAVPGFRNDAQCEFMKTRPGPLEIKQIVLTVET